MSMKLELNIVEDKELRAFVREYIKNEVVGVAREEISAAIKTALDTATKPGGVLNLVNTVVKQEVQKRIQSSSVSTSLKTAAKECIDAKVNEYLIPEKMDTIVTEAATRSTAQLAHGILTEKLRTLFGTVVP